MSTSSLILPSLEIQGFRGFRKLVIERLGRVNLIVGKNNVGKTSVLEALRLYANPASPRVLLDMITSRDEFDQPRGPQSRPVIPAPVPIEAIFHGRLPINNLTPAISIGPIDNTEMTLRVTPKIRQQGRTRRSITMPKTKHGYLMRVSKLTPFLLYEKSHNRALIRIDDVWRLAHSENVVTTSTEGLRDNAIKSQYITCNGMDSGAATKAWQNINLTDYHKWITESLRIIVPQIEQVSANIDSLDKLVPIIRIVGSSDPITLRSMGDGMVRLFQLALALVNSKEGILLVDEIENGLHYSVHQDLWRLIFKVARDLNVQVFATTHSWDCIEAFQRAACEDTTSEGCLIRLGRKRDEVVATVYDETDLAVVARDHIEVR